MRTTRLLRRLKRLLKRHTIDKSPQQQPQPQPQQGMILDRESIKQNYRGSQKRQYRLYVPSGYHSDKPAPLVMVLHGCLQTHLDIEAISEFNAVAEQYNFIVAYPFVTHYTEIRTRNCWGWWLSKQITRGSGEVEDLWHIAEQISAELSIDQRRIHIAGLSSGGCMAVAALIVHPHRFASGAAVAAVAYGESPKSVVASPFGERQFKSVTQTVAQMAAARNNDRTPAPLFIVHSHDDSVVQMQAAENLRDAWLLYFGTDKTAVNREREHSTHGTVWVHTRYGKWFERSTVETLFLRGPDHGWYGGAAGRFSFPAAPRTAELIWDFFKRHTLATAATNPLDDDANCERVQV